MDKTTLPVIVGSRDFFPDRLATAAAGSGAFSPGPGWPTPRSWRPLGAKNTCGTVADRVPAGSMCCAGLTTDDLNGEVHACVSDAASPQSPRHGWPLGARVLCSAGGRYSSGLCSQRRDR